MFFYYYYLLITILVSKAMIIAYDTYIQFDCYEVPVEVQFDEMFSEDVWLYALAPALEGAELAAVGLFLHLHHVLTNYPHSLVVPCKKWTIDMKILTMKRMHQRELLRLKVITQFFQDHNKHFRWPVTNQ